MPGKENDNEWHVIKLNAWGAAFTAGPDFRYIFNRPNATNMVELIQLCLHWLYYFFRISVDTPVVVLKSLLASHTGFDETSAEASSLAKIR